MDDIMAKLGYLKDKNNERLYSQNASIGRLDYNNMEVNGWKWSYRTFVPSSGVAQGLVTYDKTNNGLLVKGAKHIEISFNIHLIDGSYSFKDDILLYVGNVEYNFQSSDWHFYNVGGFIASCSGDTIIRLAKYTDNDGNKLITSETGNFLTVRVID